MYEEDDDYEVEECQICGETLDELDEGFDICRFCDEDQLDELDYDDDDEDWDDE